MKKINLILMFILVFSIFVSAENYYVYLLMNGESIGYDSTTLNLEAGQTYVFYGSSSSNIDNVVINIKNVNQVEGLNPEIQFIPLDSGSYELDIMGFSDNELVSSQKFYLEVSEEEITPETEDEVVDEEETVEEEEETEEDCIDEEETEEDCIDEEETVEEEEMTFFEHYNCSDILDCISDNEIVKFSFKNNGFLGFGGREFNVYTGVLDSIDDASNEVFRDYNENEDIVILYLKDEDHVAFVPSNNHDEERNSLDNSINELLNQFSYDPTGAMFKLLGAVEHATGTYLE